ncbi:uncharacterized protein N7529_002437 [Penicillium soppii]|uniref:uncharacterized protein n=1 Tax=Penicillium soppii TaxID=69789 RepID=UPI0025499A00|nr:uncharacterized protein N7529_002437 [Penicillium soppii]KAJ5874007.1 hypothetical protein N7529_002437 [Penicillium soppii]
MMTIKAMISRNLKIDSQTSNPIVRAMPDTLSLRNGSSKEPPNFPSHWKSKTPSMEPSPPNACSVKVSNSPAYLGTEGPFQNCVFAPVPTNASLDSGGHVPTRIQRHG